MICVWTIVAIILKVFSIQKMAPANLQKQVTTYFYKACHVLNRMQSVLACNLSNFSMI